MKAFTNYLKTCLSVDSGSHPRYHWWTGESVKRCYLLDREHAFNAQGRRALSSHLAEKTLRQAEIDIALGNKMYLGKRHRVLELDLGSKSSEGLDTWTWTEETREEDQEDQGEEKKGETETKKAGAMNPDEESVLENIADRPVA